MYIDFRSDTVTQPTLKMREAMFEAVVGDDVYGDDPTVNDLEKRSAEILGKEDAMFVPSGTMGNQICIMTHINRGDEIILGETNHIVVHEVGAAAILSSAFIRTIKFENEIPEPEKIEYAIRPENIHFPKTGLICLENATSMGKVVPVEIMKNTYELAKRYSVPVHLDGARLFNASTSLNVDPKEITQYCDSVMVCLSKGLCAPVGSVVAGSKEFIKRARKNRKLLGGGLRQAGFLAAAGIVAIEEMRMRIKEDHDNARYLAKRLAELSYVDVDIDSVQINMVFCKIDLPDHKVNSLPKELFKRNIKINPQEDGLFRFVTTNDISRKDVDELVDSIIDILS